MILRGTKCFYCSKKIKKDKSFKVELRTADGMHNVFLCKDCAKEFDKIMIEMEQIIHERPEPL